MTDTPDWADRFDEELAVGMLRRSQGPEGGETGVPAYLGILRATSRVVSLTKKTAVVTVDCENDGRMVGTALGTIALTPPRGPEDQPRFGGVPLRHQSREEPPNG